MKTWKWMGGRGERRNMGRGVREPQISAAISSSLRVMPWEGAILSRGGWVCVRLCVYILLQSGDALISTVMCTNVLLGRSTELSCNTPSFYDSLLFFLWSLTGKDIISLTRHVSPINPVCFLRQLCVLPERSTTNSIQTWEKRSALKPWNSISRIICISWAILEHHRKFKWICCGSEISDTVNRWKQTQRFVLCNFSHRWRKAFTAKFMFQKRAFIPL